jgi:uncharacterized damage-inducible protein DinB
MIADACRHFYEYHFSENRKIWDAYVMPLSDEQFRQHVGYSVGSVQNQIVHMMSADEQWFSGLRGLDFPEWLNPTDFEDRKAIRLYWDNLEQTMRNYLVDLRDESIFRHPFTEGADQALTVFQVLLHVVNHGTDHRAQVLRLLNDLGVETTAQDYIFYIFDNLGG